MIWVVVIAVWLLAILAIVFQPVYRIGSWWLDRRLAHRSGPNKPAHAHGAWCHPSADGCPDRPGM